MHFSPAVILLTFAASVAPVLAYPPHEGFAHLPHSHDISTVHPHPHHHQIHEHPSDMQELYTRAKAVKKIIKGGIKILTSRDINEIRDYLEARDLEERDGGFEPQELNARAKGIKKIIKGGIKILTSRDINEIREYLEARDLEERDAGLDILARALATAEAHETAGSPPKGYPTAAGNGQSGALGFGKLIKGGLKLFGLRDLHEAREYLDQYERELNELD